MQKSEKKIEKTFFCTKKSEIFSATRCCFSFFDTMLGSYFINIIRHIIRPDGRIVWKIIAGDRIWCRAQVMVSRCFANKVDLGTSQIDVKPQVPPPQQVPPFAASPPTLLFIQFGILRRQTNHSARFWRSKTSTHLNI